MTPDEMRRAAAILECASESHLKYYAEGHDLARLLREQADAMGWRPIETAPRDGTCVLLCWARNANGKSIDWTKDTKTAGVFVQAASWWQGDGWVVYCNLVRDPSLHFDPTHWQPLPPPPGEDPDKPAKPRRPVEICPHCNGTGWQD
jgi:hypothetical protein